jgi:hypothetical protein
VRSTSTWFSEWLDHALGSYVIDAKPDSFHYSIVVGESGEGSSGRPKPRKLHILYRGTAAIVRTTDLQTIARALFGELSAASLSEREDAIYLSAGALVGGASAALVPGYFVARLARLRRRAEISGLLLPGTTSVALDLESRRLLPLPELEVPPDALSRLADGRASHQPDHRSFIDQPVELGAMLSLGPSAAPGLQPIARALTLYRWSAKVLNLAKLGGPAVEGLGRALEDLPCFQVGWQDPANWLGALGHELGSDRAGSVDVDYAPRGSGNTPGGR